MYQSATLRMHPVEHSAVCTILYLCVMSHPDMQFYRSCWTVQRGASLSFSLKWWLTKVLLTLGRLVSCCWYVRAMGGTQLWIQLKWQLAIGCMCHEWE